MKKLAILLTITTILFSIFAYAQAKNAKQTESDSSALETGVTEGIVETGTAANLSDSTEVAAADTQNQSNTGETGITAAAGANITAKTESGSAKGNANANTATTAANAVAAQANTQANTPAAAVTTQSTTKATAAPTTTTVKKTTATTQSDDGEVCT